MKYVNVLVFGIYLALILWLLTATTKDHPVSMIYKLKQMLVALWHRWVCSDKVYLTEEEVARLRRIEKPTPESDTDRLKESTK